MPIPRYQFESHSPLELGRAHGESLKTKIKEIYEIRLNRCLTEPQFKTQEQVLTLAQAHLPILEAFDKDLYDELLGISEGSTLKPEDILLINHYTDLRDIGYPTDSTQVEEDSGGCSVVFSPSSEGNLFGQTWDIHGSAVDYVVLLDIKNKEHHCVTFSIAGCFGMTGLSSTGVGVCINNLNSLDARVGIVWPALVRHALKQNSAKKAKDAILAAPLGSGHYYGIADTKDFFGIETSGTLKKVVQSGTRKCQFHVNHCLDKELSKMSRVREGSTTYAREEILNKSTASKPENLQELYALLAKVSYPPDKANMHKTATCGAFLMNLNSRQYADHLGHLSDHTQLSLNKFAD